MPLDRRQFMEWGVAASLLAHAGLTAKGQTPPRNAAEESPFLQGNFAPVTEEIVAERLEVIGQLPAELNGMYVRNGPNPRFRPRGRYHWFDGDGMLHGVRLQAGRASYRNRYVRTAGLAEEERAGRAIYTGLAEPPDLLRIAQGQPPVKNAANTALVRHHGKLLALWEAGPPHEIRTPELTTAGLFNFGGRLRHPFTAHPKIEPTSGDMRFFGYSPVPPYLHYAVANREGALVHTTTINLPRAVMMHDFAITTRHALFLDLPVTFNIARLIRGEPVLAYEPRHGARIGVLEHRARGADVRWFSIEPCYVFHTLNAFEEGDEIHLIGCRMAGFPAELSGARRRPMAETETPYLYRWRLNLRTGQVRENRIAEECCEFPRHHEDRAGRPHRFAYAGAIAEMKFRGLSKTDLTSGATTVHEHGPGRFGGEGVFVPRAGATAEDDGWLMTFVHDERESRSELVVCHAGDMRARPVARVVIPARVPYGFHGTWVPMA